MFTVAFETDEDPFWDWDSSVSSVFQDWYCFSESEIDDEDILESEFYRLVEDDDICPVPCHDSYSVEYEFIETILQFGSRYTMIPTGIREPHSEVEEHEHEESTSDEVKSSDEIFYIDNNSSEDEFESGKRYQFCQCCKDSFCHMLIVCVYSSPIEWDPSACHDEYEINGSPWQRVYDFWHIRQTKDVEDHMVVEFAITFEFAKYRTEDIIEPIPSSDMIPLEESPIMVIAISIEKYILRRMYIPFLEPGRSAAIDRSWSDKIQVISSEILVSLDKDRFWEWYI